MAALWSSNSHLIPSNGSDPTIKVRRCPWLKTQDSWTPIANDPFFFWWFKKKPGKNATHFCWNPDWFSSTKPGCIHGSKDVRDTCWTERCPYRWSSPDSCASGVLARGAEKNWSTSRCTLRDNQYTNVVYKHHPILDLQNKITNLTQIHQNISQFWYISGDIRIL